MQLSARRRTFATIVPLILGIMLLATLLPAPAAADHGTREDCTQPATRDNVCLPDGMGSVTLYDPYRPPCRYDGTVTWGDGATDTVSDWQDLQTVYHQYTSHGLFTLVSDVQATPEQDGAQCEGHTNTWTVEVPTPSGEATPTPTPTPTPTEEGRISSSSFPLSHRIDRAKQELKSQIDPLIALHTDLEKKVVAKKGSLENQVELYEFRLANVRTIEAQLSELRQDIADGIGSEDSDEMVRLRRFLKEAQLTALAERLRMQNMDRDVRALMLQRDEVGKQLLELSEPLEALDFELLGLLVEVKGSPVYGVVLTSPYGRLAQLNRQIRELHQLVEELKTERKAALKTFSEAHQAASDQLLAISRLIWNNAVIKAAVDSASFGVDLAIAATKGGIAGVTAELATKLFEAAVKYSQLEPVGDPNPGAAAVDEWFQSSMLGEVGESALELGVTRGVKESLIKVPKDYLADVLEGRFPGLGPATDPGDAAAASQRAVQRARGFVQRIKDLKPKLATETFRRGFREWATKSVGRKLLQDSVKAFINKSLENAEMAAWREYIMLNSQAQGLFSLWQAAANAYWETYDDLTAKELEKARILEEFDPNTGQSLKLQESFEAPATLKIELVVRDSAKPFAQIPIQVFVSGVQATRVSAKVWRIATNALPPDDLDALVIEVR